MVEYLEFVEEYLGQGKLNLFDKVKVISARTRDLYEGKTSKVAAEANLEHRKPSTIAHYEVIKGIIEPEVREKEVKTEEYLDDMELDE